MALSLTISLSTVGEDAILFDIYSNLDSYAIPFKRGVTRAQLLSGYRVNNVPSGTTSIQLRARCNCVNSINFTVPSIVMISVTPTPSPEVSPTPTITPSISITPTVTPSISITPTITPSISVSVSITPTITITPTVTPSITASITATPSVTPSVTITPSVTVTPGLSPSMTPTITPSITVSSTVTPSVSVSVTPTVTITPSISESVTPTVTPSISVTPTVTPSISVTPTITPTITVSPTASPIQIGVIYDASTQSTKTTSTGSYSFSHTPVSTPYGIVVFALNVDTSTDQLSGITYAGVPMYKVTGSTWDGGGSSPEPMNASMWFIGSGSGGYAIPTGNQNIIANFTSATTDTYWFTAISLTNSFGYFTEVLDSASLAGMYLDASATFNYNGINGFAIAGVGQGFASSASLTLPSTLSSVQGYTNGSRNGFVFRQNTFNDQGINIGYTASLGSSDDTAFTAIALRTIVPPSVTPTPTVTPSITVSPTRTSTPTVTPSISVSPTQTATQTPTVTPSISVSPTRTPTQTPTVTPSISVSTTSTPTVTPSISVSPTITPTGTPTRTATQTPTVTPSISVSPTQTATQTPTVTPSISVSPTQTATRTPTVTPSISVSPTRTATQTPTVTPSISVSPTQTPTQTPTVTPSISVSPTQTATQTPTVTPSISVSPTRTPTQTPTVTPSISVSPTQTPTQTPTVTPSISVSPTLTPTPTPSPLIQVNIYGSTDASVTGTPGTWEWSTNGGSSWTTKTTTVSSNYLSPTLITDVTNQLLVTPGTNVTVSVRLSGVNAKYAATTTITNPSGTFPYCGRTTTFTLSNVQSASNIYIVADSNGTAIVTC